MAIQVNQGFNLNHLKGPNTFDLYCSRDLGVLFCGLPASEEKWCLKKHISDKLLDWEFSGQPLLVVVISY